MIRSVLMATALAAAATAVPANAQDRSLKAEMQRLEQTRDAAIRTGDMNVLSRIYAEDFHGLTSAGAWVDRDGLFALFRQNAGGDSAGFGEILSLREENDLVFAEGRLRLYADTGTHQRLVGESSFLHIFRKRGRSWEMVAGASATIPQGTR